MPAASDTTTKQFLLSDQFVRSGNRNLEERKKSRKNSIADYRRITLASKAIPYHTLQAPLQLIHPT